MHLRHEYTYATTTQMRVQNTPEPQETGSCPLSAGTEPAATHQENHYPHFHEQRFTFPVFELHVNGMI